MLGIAIAADPIILIDNVTKTLRSDALDVVLTGTEFSERVLGRNENLTLTVRTVFVATANNATLSPDLVRRSIHVRLEPETERPEQRSKFRYHPLLEHIETHRARYLGAALTVLRAWFVAGAPVATMRAMGSYEAWSRVVRGALIWAGQPDPALTQDALREGADAESETAAAVIAAWYAVFREGAVTVSSVLSTISDSQPDPDVLRLRQALSELCDCDPGKAPSPKRLGQRLRALRGKVTGMLIFERGDGDTHAKVASWRTRVTHCS